MYNLFFFAMTTLCILSSWEVRSASCFCLAFQSKILLGVLGFFCLGGCFSVLGDELVLLGSRGTWLLFGELGFSLSTWSVVVVESHRDSMIHSSCEG